MKNPDFIEFESITHALHFAKGSNIEVVFIDNKVIDVTQFKHTHPGGAESINKYIGTECSEMYRAISSHRTVTAVRELKSFAIGYIKTDTNKKPIQDDIQDTDMNYGIDLTKGTIWQVFTKLNKEEYMAFIHDPKHLINPPEAVMFDSPYLEVFTKTPWYVIPIIWIPYVIWNLYLARTYDNLPFAAILVSFAVGVFLWTWIEYFLHRFVFHIDEDLPNNSYAFLIHYLLHGIHHAFPMDRNRLVFPPVAAIPILFCIRATYFFLFNKFAYAFMAGTMVGYICYDLTHYFIHHESPYLEYFKSLKKYHILHHYKNPKLGFGVSNKLWDYVLDTVLTDKSDDKKLQKPTEKK